MRIRLSLKAILSSPPGHEADYDIVICTGRPLAGVTSIFEEIGLPE